MSVAYDLDPLPPRALDVELAPGGIESNEPPMESDQHLRQMLLLVSSLDWWWRDRTDYYAAGNLTIYFSPRQLKSEDFRGPDFFVVLGTTKEPRKSWVVWDEGGKYPNVIVEVISDSTEKVDRGLKRQVYQDVFRTPEYFLFDPETRELEGYRLVDGVYQPIERGAEGRLPSRQLALALGVHEGRLRLFTPEGELLPDTMELGYKAEAERARADDERKRADEAEQRARALEAKLRAMGIDPDALK
jgi:Uma2 family endonuclease